jgi:Dot/Icm secretion system protein IcmQ
MMLHDRHKILNEQLTQILRDLLAVGDWEASLFLRTAYKKLEYLYKQAATLLELDSNDLQFQEEQNHLKARQGYIKVFISIYQSDPHNLVKWENTLKNIREYSINRPIYRFEEYVQAMIRSKGSFNEGYVVIFIQPTDIIPPYIGKVIQDRWGHELLTIRDNSLLSGNISEFVHESRRYEFRDGKLILRAEQIEKADRVS